jgi:hypothetical protein
LPHGYAEIVVNTNVSQWMALGMTSGNVWAYKAYRSALEEGDRFCGNACRHADMGSGCDSKKLHTLHK